MAFTILNGWETKAKDEYLATQTLMHTNKILLKHSHDHSFIHCLWLLQFYNGELRSWDRDRMAFKERPRQLLSGLCRSLPTLATEKITATSQKKIIYVKTLTIFCEKSFQGTSDYKL